MKKFVFLVFSFLLISNAFAQRTEYSIHLHSGFFSFGGESAASHSFIIVSDVATIDNYTNNPYGKEPTPSYGLAGQINHITKQNLIFGIQSGYEVLRSRVDINGISGEFMVAPEVTSGNTVLSHGFINLYPHVGKKFIFDEIEADLAIGPEFGFNTFSREKGEANLDNDTTVQTDTERNDPGTDIRIRPQLTLLFQNWGISAGYSYGLHNYSANLTGGNRKRYSRFIRFGISYVIK